MIRKQTSPTEPIWRVSWIHSFGWKRGCWLRFLHEGGDCQKELGESYSFRQVNCYGFLRSGSWCGFQVVLAASPVGGTRQNYVYPRKLTQPSATDHVRRLRAVFSCKPGPCGGSQAFHLLNGSCQVAETSYSSPENRIQMRHWKAYVPIPPVNCDSFTGSSTMLWMTIAWTEADPPRRHSISLLHGVTNLTHIRKDVSHV